MQKDMDFSKFAQSLGHDEDDLPDIIDKEGKVILTLGWDADRPDGAGASHIIEWNGAYFFMSSDIDTEGPYDNLEEAIALEYFHTNGTPKPEIYSDVLPFEQLEAIARDIDEDRQQEIVINDEVYEWDSDSLRRKETADQ
jgi:hypothetical protein